MLTETRSKQHKTKEDLEVEKLELEVQELQRPSYQRPSVMFTAVSAIAALIGVFAQSWLSNIKTEKAGLELVRAEQLRDKMKQEATKLVKQTNDLKKEVAELETRKITTNKALAELIAISKAQPNPQTGAIQSAENARYGIKLVALKAPTMLFNTVRSKIQEYGYALVDDYILDERTSWISLSSTVLYYDEQSRVKAEQLASHLEELTQLNFEVKRGAGLGVNPGDEKWTFIIHLIP